VHLFSIRQDDNKNIILFLCKKVSFQFPHTDTFPDLSGKKPAISLPFPTVPDLSRPIKFDKFNDLA